MRDATVERTFHQLALIHIFEDIANRAAGHLSIDTHRLELTHHTRPAVTLHEHVRAREGQCCPAIIERTAAPKLRNDVVDRLGRDLPRPQALPNLKFTQLASRQPLQTERVGV
jgi:hypothetical protein